MFLSHVFLSQLRLSFSSSYLLRWRKKIQVTYRQIQKTLLVSPLLTWPRALFWLARQSLCRRLLFDHVTDNIWHSVSRLKIDSSILHPHIAHSRLRIPFSCPVNLYSSCLSSIYASFWCLIDWAFLQISWRVLQWHMLIQVFLQSFQNLTGQRKQTAAANMPNNNIQKIGASFKICVEHLLVWQIA